MSSRLKFYGSIFIFLLVVCASTDYYFQDKLTNEYESEQHKQKHERGLRADADLQSFQGAYEFSLRLHAQFKRLVEDEDFSGVKDFTSGLNLISQRKVELMTWALIANGAVTERKVVQGELQEKSFYENLYKLSSPNAEKFELIVVDNQALMKRVSRFTNSKGQYLVISRVALDEHAQSSKDLLKENCWSYRSGSQAFYLKANSSGILRVWNDFKERNEFEAYTLTLGDLSLEVFYPQAKIAEIEEIWQVYYEDRIRVVWILGGTLFILLIVFNEARLTASESRFYKQTMSSLSSFGVFTLDESGLISHHNEYFPKLLDSVEDDLCGTPLISMLDYDQEEFDQVLRSLKAGEDEVDVIVTHKFEGVDYFKELHLSTSQHFSKDHCFYGTINDVTARERNHQRIEEHEHNLELYNQAICRILEIPVDDHKELASILQEICRIAGEVLETSTSMIWVLDESGEEISCEARMSEIEDLPPREMWKMKVEECKDYLDVLEQKRVHNIKRIKDHPCYEKMQGVFEMTGVQSRMDAIIRVHLKSRGVLVFEKKEECKWSKSEIGFAASVADQISVLINIYDSLHEQEILRVARRDAEELSEAKGDFLAIMSHELRTPLNAIIGFTELLKLNKELDNDSRYYVDALKKSSQGLLSLVNNILDFSKMEAQKLDLNIESKDLLPICLAACDMVSSIADKKNINLNLRWQVDPGLIVEVDEGRFQQVLVNLLSNALKFTTEGHVMLWVKLEGDKQVRIGVEDTGCGIPKEKEAALFEKFFQVDSSNKRKHGGTGLGLPIAKNLVEMMGGELELDNKPNVGCSFSFALPLSIQEASEKPPYDKNEILFYSENQDAETQTQILEDYGLEVQLYHDLNEAQGAVHAGLSFVLCDLTCFDFSKPLTPMANFVKKIKRRSPPAIVCAMIRFGQYADDIMACGFTHYLFPPFFRTDAILGILNDELPEVKRQVDELMDQTCQVDLSEEIVVQEIITLAEGEKYQVLVISDNSLLRIRANLVLKKYPTQVDAASCLEEFQAFIEEATYHYLLVDVNFAEELNLNTCKFLDSRPRIFGLGDSSGESLVEGLDQYLQIPLQTEELDGLFVTS